MPLSFQCGPPVGTPGDEIEESGEPTYHSQKRRENR